MYKIIASDLDETLLDDTHHIPKRVRTAIAAAHDAGAKFVPATGRGFTTVRDALEELGLAGQPDEYVISFNGGVVVENAGDRILSKQGVTWDFANRIWTYGRELGDVCVHIYTMDTVWVLNYNDAERAYVGSRMNMVESFEPTLDFLRGEDIIKCLYMSLDVPYLRRIATDLADLTRDIDVSYSSNRYLEFNARGVNKGSGLLGLAKALGVRPEETMAIGDNYNDLSMVEAAGMGVFVANAPQELHERADYVCEADNNAGGVAEAIERFVLSA